MACFTCNSPIMPTKPSVHQALPLWSTVIMCGVRPPGGLERMVYSFIMPFAAYSPIRATAGLFSVNQILLLASTLMPYGRLFAEGVVNSLKACVDVLNF